MIDTLQISRELQNTGFTQNQADSIARMMLELPNTAELATKVDLAELKVQLIYWIVGSVGLSTLLQLAASFARH